MLIDIPRLKGVPYLEPGTAIYQEDVEAWEKMARREDRVRRRDPVADRPLGAARESRVRGPVGRNAAGFHASIAPLIKARGVAIVGSDAASEVTPTMVEGVNLPVHTLLITALGINILDNQDLERLAETAAKTQAVGIHDHDQPDADHRRHGIADEYAGDVLSRRSGHQVIRYQRRTRDAKKAAGNPTPKA